MPNTSTPPSENFLAGTAGTATVSESAPEGEQPGVCRREASVAAVCFGAVIRKFFLKPNIVLAGLCGFLVLGLVSGCEMQQDIEVNLPAHEPVTLVECYLEPGAPARLLATRSVGFFDTLEVVPADDLQVSLYENGRQIQLENRYQGDTTYFDFFNYTSFDTIRFDENTEWELVVRRQDEEIARSTARFLPKPKVQKIDYKLSADSLLTLEIFLEDNPAQKNFYRLRVYTKNMAPSSGFKGLWNDQLADGNMLKINTGVALKAHNDTVIVSLYHIGESYHTFLRSVQKAYDANYNPFAQPANLESNLQGEAVGVFTAISGVTDTLYLQR